MSSVSCALSASNVAVGMGPLDVLGSAYNEHSTYESKAMRKAHICGLCNVAEIGIRRENDK